MQSLDWNGNDIKSSNILGTCVESCSPFGKIQKLCSKSLFRKRRFHRSCNGTSSCLSVVPRYTQIDVPYIHCNLCETAVFSGLRWDEEREGRWHACCRIICSLERDADTVALSRIPFLSAQLLLFIAFMRPSWIAFYPFLIGNTLADCYTTPHANPHQFNIVLLL